MRALVRPFLTPQQVLKRGLVPVIFHDFMVPLSTQHAHSDEDTEGEAEEAAVAAAESAAAAAAAKQAGRAAAQSAAAAEAAAVPDAAAKNECEGDEGAGGAVHEGDEQGRVMVPVTMCASERARASAPARVGRADTLLRPGSHWRSCSACVRALRRTPCPRCTRPAPSRCTATTAAVRPCGGTGSSARRRRAAAPAP